MTRPYRSTIARRRRWDPALVQLVIYLCRVGLLDSAGLGALVSVSNEADRAGHTIALIRSDDSGIARLFRLCGLHRAFAIEQDLRERVAPRQPAGAR